MKTLIPLLFCLAMATNAAADTATYQRCGCTITHNSDGTWSLNCGGSTTTYSSGYSLFDLEREACKGK